jgi:hypothetical protein
MSLPKTIDEFIEARVAEAVTAERKKILDGILVIDRAADTPFDFGLALRSYFASEFKTELRELKK